MKSGSNIKKAYCTCHSDRNLVQAPRLMEPVCRVVHDLPRLHDNIRAARLCKPAQSRDLSITGMYMQYRIREPSSCERTAYRHSESLVRQMMKFAFKTMDFAFKMMNCVFKRTSGNAYSLDRRRRLDRVCLWFCLRSDGCAPCNLSETPMEI